MDLLSPFIFPAAFGLFWVALKAIDWLFGIEWTTASGRKPCESRPRGRAITSPRAEAAARMDLYPESRRNVWKP